MEKAILYFSVSSIILFFVSTSYSSEYWSKTYGGSGDLLSNNLETSDGGLIAARETSSVVTPNDGWIVKLDSSGNVESPDSRSTDSRMVDIAHEIV